MLDNVINKILSNKLVCDIGHTFVGILSAIFCLMGQYTTGGIILFSFIAYEALEQFSGLKDDCDEELRQALWGFNFTLIVGVIIRII